MRAALLVVVALHATAVAQPKPVPDKHAKAAKALFVQALEADQAGDLPTALGLYQKAFGTSPHPATAYNIADVYRRNGALSDAILYYEIYLALSPGTKDAKEVEALIAKLAATPAVLLLESSPPSDPESVDLASAYVIVGGTIVKRAGEPAGFDPQTKAPRVELSVPPGEQQVDVITPLSYGAVTCRLPPGEKRDCKIRMVPRTDGSLVVNTSDDRRDMELDVSPKKRVTRERVAVPAGKQRLGVRDHNLECGLITVDVPKGDDVAYVFFHAFPFGFHAHCRPFKVTQHRLVFKAD